MADQPPRLPEDETPEGGAKSPQGVSQEDIDAALAAAGGGDLPEPETTENAELTEQSNAGAIAAAGEMEALVADAQAFATDEVTGSENLAAQAAVEMEMPDFGGAESTANGNELELLSDVRLDVKIELGRSDMYIEDVLKLGKGSVVELDRLAGDPVDVLVNERLVARGEVLVLNDNFCVRITEILVGKDL